VNSSGEFDLVLGTPGDRICLWPSTNKQGSGVGHTLNASFMSLALTNKQGSGVGHTLNASQEKRYSRLSMGPSIYLCSSLYNM
jgi:hypothetical protein